MTHPAASIRQRWERAEETGVLRIHRHGKLRAQAIKMPGGWRWARDGETSTARVYGPYATAEAAERAAWPVLAADDRKA